MSTLSSAVNASASALSAERTRIEFAALGNKAGFIGAAACARALIVGG